MSRLLARLELKVPPVAVALALMASMKLVAGYGPPLLPDAGRADAVGWGLMLLGLGLAIAGVASFSRHDTTVDPMHPERAGALVESGIYRFTRNPMYLGFVVLLLGVAFLVNGWTAVHGPVMLALWLDRFQIRPEERLLRERFGDDFVAYCQRVPRWIGRRRGRSKGR
ncbi:methyltransferase family protein [Halomonas denitrificans]|nr:isoprenylcysteine carboxylmethyltransferase family protein [Halomonas denitrificans]